MGETNGITPQQSGTYHVIFSANDGHNLYEGNYANDVSLSVPLTVNVPGAAADLAVLAATPPPTTWRSTRAVHSRLPFNSVGP